MSTPMRSWRRGVRSGGRSESVTAPPCSTVVPSSAPAANEQKAPLSPPSGDHHEGSDVDGEISRYEWDLDGDGVFGDALGQTAEHFYADEGSYRVSVRVSDASHATDTQSMIVTVTGTIGTADLSEIGRAHV